MSLLTILMCFCAIALLLIFFLLPAESTKEQRKPFQGSHIAHRGLYKKDQSVPENSLAAFTAAIDAGYAIEMDLQLSADDEVLVFHDTSLERACKTPGKLEEKTSEECQALRLFDSEQKIPTLREVLNLVNQKVPLLLELKPGRDYKKLCENTWRILRLYDGDIAIESFDPRIVRWFKKNAPGVLRGQLSAPMKTLGYSLQGFSVSFLFTNCIGRPHFIAYQIGPRPPTVFIVALICMRVVWTVTPADAHDFLQQTNDAIIFEFYEPEPYFFELN